MTKYLTLQFINGSVLWALCICVAIGLPLWYRKKLRRFTAVILAVAAGLAVIGIPVWQDTLASLVSTSRAAAILCVPTGVILITWGDHIYSARKPKKVKDPDTGEKVEAEPHKDHYHHRVTVMLGIVGFTLLGIVILDGANVLANIRKAPAGTGSALANARANVASGHAAAQAHHAGATTIVVLVAVVVGLVVLWRVMGRHEHVQDDNIAVAQERQARATQLRAIEAGGRPVASRQSRRALPGGGSGFGRGD